MLHEKIIYFNYKVLMYVFMYYVNRPLCLLVFFDTVCWAMLPVEIVPEMTCYAVEVLG